MENIKMKASILVLLLCVLIAALKYPPPPNNNSKNISSGGVSNDASSLLETPPPISVPPTNLNPSSSPSISPTSVPVSSVSPVSAPSAGSPFASPSGADAPSEEEGEGLRYDYYAETCPSAEQAVRTIVRMLYPMRPDIAPALLRLVFHDCFVGGCDASVLLDAADNVVTEKNTPPNFSLSGYDVIDAIKLALEVACPGVVSCSDILVLAARESVLLTGGPFYPLYTGRRDSTEAFHGAVILDIPNPDDNLSRALQRFTTKGFSAREAVALLGAHSTGKIHCKFITSRLHKFNRTNDADPALDAEFLERLRSVCNQSNTAAPSSSPSLSPSSSSSPPDESDHFMKMDFEGPGINFGSVYYRSLLQGRGILFVDQQLTAGEETKMWVQTYASDVQLFQADFGRTMIKLSDLNALTAPQGQVRLDCRKLN